MQLKYILYSMLLILCYVNNLYSWGSGWSTGASELYNGGARFYYDNSSGQWKSNKPISSSGSNSLIQGSGTDNLDIDANGLSITLGNADDDYVNITDTGKLSFIGNAYLNVNDDIPLSFGNDNDGVLKYDTTGAYDFLGLGLKTGSSTSSGYIVIGSDTTIGLANAVPSSSTTYPKLRFLCSNVVDSADYHVDLYASTYGTFNVGDGTTNNFNFRSKNTSTAISILTSSGVQRFKFKAESDGHTISLNPYNGMLYLQDGRKFDITTVNASTHTLAINDYLLHITYTNTGACTITIPTSQAVSGRVFEVKDAGFNASTNNITIATEGTETIDESSIFVITTNGGSYSFYSDGTDWFVK